MVCSLSLSLCVVFIRESFDQYLYTLSFDQYIYTPAKKR